MEITANAGEMVGTRWTRVLGRLLRVSRYKPLLLTEREMRALIDIESARCNRSNSCCYSVVLFETAGGAPWNSKLAEQLAGPVRRRLRHIDSLGWLAGRIAILMPQTSEVGAKKVAEDLLLLAFSAEQVRYSVASYPDGHSNRRDSRSTGGGSREKGSGDARNASDVDQGRIRSASVDPEAYRHPLHNFLQRTESGWVHPLYRLCAVTMLLAACPVIACAAFWIQLRDPGPVFFRQRRIGYLGVSFDLFKLRTMRADSGESQHIDHVKSLIASGAPLTKLDTTGDGRVILGSALIRKLGIDELPQLYNVIRGEMSLVGPRPCIPDEAGELKQWQRARFNVHPGLTGLWQVSGKNRTTFRRMLQLDVGYSNKRSLWLDIYILLKTLPAVVAYARDK